MFKQWWVIVFLGVSSVHAEQRYFVEPEPLEGSEFRDLLSQVGPELIMAVQPTVLGLRQMAQQGVTMVINLRTMREMNDRSVVPFDEAAEVSQLGLTYVHLPSGGAQSPYSRAIVDQFAKALEQADGPVLLHCTVGWRASHLWVAYLVAYEQVPLPKALDIARQLNFGDLPVEGFLGQPLTLTPIH